MMFGIHAWGILYSRYPRIGDVAGVDISRVVEREILSRWLYFLY